MNAPRSIGGWLAGTILLAAILVRPANAQTHFIVSVPPAGVPTFQNLATFAGPTGVGTGRVTFIKLVTNGTGVPYQIQRLVGQAAHVEPNGPVQVISVPPVGSNIADVAALLANDPAPCPATTVAAGYQMVCLIVSYDDAFDFGAGQTWQLNVQQHTTNPFEYFGWASTVGSGIVTAEANVTAARLQASSELDFGGVQRNIASNHAPALAPTVRNIGTAPLTITGGPISSDPAPTFFSTPVFVPAPLNPGASLVNNFGANQGIWVMARPTALGARQSTLTIQAGAEAAPVTLRATGVTLFAHLLMDCSGSMGWQPNGSNTAVETETRLFAAKEAGQEINNWIDGFTDEDGGYVGLSTFGECVPFSTVGKLQVPINLSSSTVGTIGVAFGPTAFNGLTAGGWTPMQSGIETAVANMDARINNAAQQPNVADVPNLRQAILLMSDGAQTDGNAAATIPALVNKGIMMYTIAYGVPGSSAVDHNLLSNLSGATQGASWDANSLAAFELKNAFKSAVQPWLGLESVVDPTGTIRAAQNRSHTVCVDPRAYGATFVVDWDRPAAGGVVLTLQSPTGEIITPSTSGVAFYSGQTFAQYIIRGNRVRGGAGAGQWTIRLAGGQSIPGNEATNYSYSVLVQTPIRVQPVKRWDLVTGLQYVLEVQLPGWPPEYRENVVINARYDAPAASFGTHLATGKVERAWFFPAQQADSPPSRVSRLFDAMARPLFAQQRARQDTVRVPRMFMDEPATIAQRKAWALANIAGQPFANERTTGTLQLYDDGTHGDRIAGDGIYSATAPALRHEGLYKYAFEIATPGGARQLCINRDVRVNDLVAVHLSPGLIADNLKWHKNVKPDLFFDPQDGRALTATEPQSGFRRSAAVFTPKDEFGNHWGPGKANDIAFAVKNGEPIGSVVDNWDGSYVQLIEHRDDARPAVVVTAAGVASAPLELARAGLPWWVWLIIILIASLVIILLLRKRPWS